MQDYTEYDCYPFNCDQLEIEAPGPTIAWRRGIFHLYVDSRFEYRKYYMFGEPKMHVQVDDAKIMQISNSNSDELTSFSSNWQLNLTEDQSVEAAGAAVIVIL